MPTVNLPDGTRLNFPDGMSQDDMAAAINKLLAKRDAAQPAATPPQVPQDVSPLSGVRRFLSGLAKNAEQGLALGFGDELQAGMGAAVDYVTGKDGSLGDLYDQRLAAERKAVKDFHDAHPVLATGAEIAGSLPTMRFGMGGPVRRGLGLVAQGAKVGGATGALSGFGSAESGVRERLAGAATGATVGATLGGAIPLALGGGGATVNSALMAAGLRDADTVARNKALQKFAADGVTADDVAVRLADIAKPQAVMDVAGQNTLGLACAAASVPGTSRQKAFDLLEGRQSGRLPGRFRQEGAAYEHGSQVSRLADDVRATIAPQTYHDEAAALIARREAESAPAYAKAMDAAPVWDERLQQFLDDPISKAGLRQGLEIQRLESLARGEKFNPLDFAVTGFNEAGDPVLAAVPNMRTLNVVKKGLDNILEGYRDKTTGRLALDERGRAVDEVRRAFLATVDGLNPDYAAARSAWAGPTRARDLMQRGRDFATMDAPDIAREVVRMSDADREFYRIGVAQGLRDRLYRDTAQPGHNAALRVSGEGLDEKLRAAVGKDRADALLHNVGVEDRLHQNRAFVRGGSQTQNKAADAADMQVDPSILGNLLRGNIATAGVNAATAAMRRASGLTPNVANSLAGLLYETDPVANRAVLQALRAQLARNQQGERAANALVNAYAGSAGAVVPGLLSSR
jgi:hypothetical protein